MTNNFNLSPDQMDALFHKAGKKMGTDPQKLRQQMENGQMEGILNELSPEQRNQLQGFINNPEAVRQFVENPKIQQLLRGFMK